MRLLIRIKIKNLLIHDTAQHELFYLPHLKLRVKLKFDLIQKLIEVLMKKLWKESFHCFKCTLLILLFLFGCFRNLLLKFSNQLWKFLCILGFKSLDSPIISVEIWEKLWIRKNQLILNSYIEISMWKQSNLLERRFCLQCAAMHREVKTTEKPCDTRVLQITQHEKAFNALLLGRTSDFEN